MQKTFYYKFKKNYIWLILNVAALAGIIFCCIRHPSLTVWLETQTLVILLTVMLVLWIYKFVLRHPMAVIDDETIKIDHTNPLKWSDIASAEEKIVNCCGKKRIISLIPKDNINYKYNFLQKHNGDFTPFSIPLYGIISPEDEEEITKIVARKVGLKRL